MTARESTPEERAKGREQVAEAKARAAVVFDTFTDKQKAFVLTSEKRLLDTLSRTFSDQKFSNEKGEARMVTVPIGVDASEFLTAWAARVPVSDKFRKDI